MHLEKNKFEQMLLKLLLKFKQSVRFLQNINSNKKTEIVIQIKSGKDLKITSPSGHGTSDLQLELPLKVHLKLLNFHLAF